MDFYSEEGRMGLTDTATLRTVAEAHHCVERLEPLDDILRQAHVHRVHGRRNFRDVLEVSHHWQVVHEVLQRDEVCRKTCFSGISQLVRRVRTTFGQCE